MRKKKTRKQKNAELRKRYDAIKNMMSTFAMSTVAVVAAVTLIPASPKAEITKVVSLSEEIVYQVQVTDEENALDLSTLYVVLENQLEYYEQPISLGENSGFFNALNNETEYRLSVYGNKGFGQERLDTIMITTRAKVGGTILSVTPIDGDHVSSYLTDIYVYDPDTKYSSITLYYGYSHEPDQEINYSSIPITQDRQEVNLSDIWTSEPFHIYLEGTTTEGVELLDEIWVTPPFNLYSSLHVKSILNSEITYSAWTDSTVEEVKYIMNIYIGDRLESTQTPELKPGDHEGYVFTIIDLHPSTTYFIEGIVEYTNPQTLRTEQKVIYEEEITTIADYSYTYEIQQVGEFFEITITLEDPDHNFQNVYYNVYDTSGEWDEYIEGETLGFTPNGETKSATFTILIPIVETYRITIGIRNEVDFQINKIIDMISQD